MQGFQYFSSLPILPLFTDGTFYYNLDNFHEYLIQHSLKSGGNKDHFLRVKVPGTQWRTGSEISTGKTCKRAQSKEPI